MRICCGLLVVGLCAAGNPAQSSPGTLTVRPGQTVGGSLHGEAVRYVVQPNGTSMLLLNPDAATRLGVKPGFIALAVRARVGPTVIDGLTTRMQYAVEGQTHTGRVAWFRRAVAPEADGALGPSAVPQSVVVFQLRDAGPDERTVVLPLVDRGFPGVGTEVRIGKSPLFVQWDLSRGPSIATAAGAADVAAAYGGTFTGPVTQEPIRFGIERPVRRIALTSALALGPLRVVELLARISDYGDTSEIPEGAADDTEIVVTAKGNKAQPVRLLVIGRDDMAGCSQIRFDKENRTIALTCRGTAP